MTALATKTSAKRRLLLASDRYDQSRELARILANVAEVETVPMAGLPDSPGKDLSGVVVDINLRSSETVQQVRRKLLGTGYQPMPRLFVLADLLHHGAMQAWALGATDTIARPFDPDDILQRIRAAFPNSDDEVESSTKAKDLSRGVAAAHLVMVKIFEKLPAGLPLTVEDVMAAETSILKAIKRTSLREWLSAVGAHHNASYRHCLAVTGFVVAFAQYLGIREEDQRRLTRAALLHDVGKAFVPTEILDHPGHLDAEQTAKFREHPQLGYDALVVQGGFPREMLDVVLHHHEMLDGGGYPNAMHGDQICDLVRIITLVDTFASLVEGRAGERRRSHDQAFTALENMGDKLDQRLVQAFRPVVLGR
jgi:putative nucleotidyltransferase with HDIG domain